MTNQVDATILHLLEHGAHSDDAIVAPDGPAVTYGSLRSQISDLASQLRENGIGQGDRVAIVLPNSIEAIICFLAVASVGAAAPLNPAYKVDEFRFYLEDTDAQALITSSEVGEEARRVASSSILQIDASMNSDGQVKLSPSGGSRKWRSTEDTKLDDVALVLHTSGTTSQPKRVPLTHRNLTISAQNIAGTYRLSPDDISLCIMPLFHVHGIVASTLSTLFTGGTVIVPPRFNALNFWDVVREHRVTWFSAVPSMHQALLNRARRREGVRIGYDGLRFIRSCSAALSSSTMLEMEERVGVPMLEAYGMTEAAHQMTSNPLPPGVRFPGTVGKGTGVKIGIMNKDGTLQEVGTQGEVVIQGPNVIQGYEDNPEANDASFTNGWFRTGDQGFLDGEGVLTLSGRIKELINRSGEKISPIEIDDVLLMHSAVSESVAFGVPHSTHGEVPSAAVVVNSRVSEKELISHCREHLSDFKCPRTIHIVDAIPRTATGKVQRRIVAAAILGVPLV